MPLGPNDATWQALADALRALADQAGATNAFVTDAWGHLWCRGRTLSSEEQAYVLARAASALDAASPPIERGGRLDGGALEDANGWYGRSFAGVYVALLLFEGRADALTVRRALREHLPRIEALTIALPPPDGSDAGAAKMRGGSGDA